MKTLVETITDSKKALNIIETILLSYSRGIITEDTTFNAGALVRKGTALWTGMQLLIKTYAIHGTRKVKKLPESNQTELSIEIKIPHTFYWYKIDKEVTKNKVYKLLYTTFSENTKKRYNDSDGFITVEEIR
ncbi:gp38 [Sphingomonas phage PAU]|uniref:gp38 n=1 Tax=Sphingomonas phage PAU TaxID=1150991 RepID=UPI000257312B|nr:gp38 [Sphingomonas phage PAU]AFF28036.1 gp38 [Sphingomonas phage PAU]